MAWAGGKFGDQWNENSIHTLKNSEMEASRGGLTFVRSHGMCPFTPVFCGEFLPICIWDKLLLAYLSAVQELHNEMFSFI